MRGLPELGQQVAGYRIEQQIGRGGMGVVYLAEQVRLRRQVALKLIAPELAEDDEFRLRFERESQLAASIDHPNVIPVYEAGEADGSLFISMRYVPGSDLRGLIQREGYLDQARAAWVISQIAAALDAAHAHGLVHRDIKPANVLISGSFGAEHAYLTDFGLTKHVSSSSGLTHTGQWVGTLDYVAPEQISGGPLDARVDIYSLGCVLFQTLTGRVPYPKESDVAKMYAHMSEPPALPSSVMAGLSGFDPVVGRALAKEPEGRYPSAGDLGRAALAAADGQQNTVPERSVAAGSAALTTERGPVAAPPAPPTAQISAPTARLPADFGPPPPPPPPVPPSPRAAGGQNWLVVAAVAVAVLAVGGAAAALIATGTFKSSGGKQNTVIVRKQVTPPATKKATQKPDGSTSFSGTGYTASIPAGWGVVEDNVNKGAYSESKFQSPDGSASVLIDRTPGAPVDPGAAARGVERDTRKTPGYQRISWGPVDLAGNPGWEWIFDLPSGRRVDYFLNAGDGRFAVLGLGSDFGSAQGAARSIAESIDGG